MESEKVLSVPEGKYVLGDFCSETTKGMNITKTHFSMKFEEMIEFQISQFMFTYDMSHKRYI